MPQIEIDFEVFKELTSRRPSEDVTYNDVIRGLLKMPLSTKSAKAAGFVSRKTPIEESQKFKLSTSNRARIERYSC